MIGNFFKSIRNRGRGLGRRAVRVGVALIFILAFAAPLRAVDQATLPAGISTILESSPYRHAWWGLLAKDLRTGQILCEYNADRLFSPASVTKLFTAAAALDRLGPDYRFRTPLYRRGRVDSKGVLHGDLILVAAGDITMGGRTLPDGRIGFAGIDHTVANGMSGTSEGLTKTDPLAGINCLASQAARSGIKSLAGEVVVDDRLFKTTRVYSVKTPGVVLFARTPMMINDNILDIVVAPARAGEPASVTWRPRYPLLKIRSSVRTTAPGGQPVLETRPAGLGSFDVSGEIPAGHPPLVRTVAITDGASLGRSLLLEALRRQGVRIKASPGAKNPAGRLPRAVDYPSLVKVGEFVSPPFSEYIRFILKASHNPGAEILPHLIALSQGKQSFADGMLLQNRFIAKIVTTPGSISLADGSGLSQANLVTPRAVVALLEYMTTHRHGRIFRDSLPVLGRDGTLAQSGEGSPAQGKIQGKTGTLMTVDLLHDSAIMDSKALGGYMTTASGRDVAFAFFVNRVHTTEVRGRVDTLKFTAETGADLIKIAEELYGAN